MLHLAQIAGTGGSRKRVILAAMGSAHRVFVVILLAVSLMLSGKAPAMHLSTAAGGEAFVICVEGGSSTVYLDQDGNPVAPMKDCANCPDCLAPAAFFAPPSRGLPERCATYHPVRTSVTEVTLPARPFLRPETRGPPPVARERLDAAPFGTFTELPAEDGYGNHSVQGRTQPAARI